MSKFKQVSSQVDFPAQEEETLAFWEKEDIFKKSVENRKGQQRFVFYEGPPTANGLPHMGHVLQRSLKDLILRYKTMKGFLVERRAGWDTHGLPVEIEVEKSLGLKGKQDILSLKESEFESIKFFNEKCQESVFKYTDEWINLTKRIGFWIDFDNAYVTFKNDYIESVWWFLSEINKKGLLYKDYKVVPYCPRCGTSLSSHELAQGYKDNTEDPAVYVKFELVDEPGTFVLAWTTTPWTLPSNTALAVGKNIEYVKVENNGEKYILAKKRLKILDGEVKVLEEIKVSELVGKKYKPLYNYLKNENSHTIYEAGFASDEDGTGVVHTGTMYGEEDFELIKREDLPQRHLINLKGQFIDEVKEYAGKFVKSADKEIIEDLKEKDALYKSETIKHTYPFCWRCGTPILYYAFDAWFIKTTAVKEKLLEDNQKINWLPKTIKNGRMKNWLETLIDWNISRNRFWGTPLPFWVCESGHIKVIGSRQELKDLGAKVPEDLHKPFIDEVEFKCEECNKIMRRIPDVADVWMDSGAMPFAQWHYPFENKEVFREWYPADYIVEGIDQTRGWFFTLMAEAMLLGNETPAPFKNVISTGLILDEKGQKMSKSKGNVVNPMEVIPASGADTMRWYMYTGAPAGGNYLFSKDLVLEKHRKFTLILWNCYKYFVDYASLMSWNCDIKVGELTILDKWILARLTEVVLLVNEKLDKYDATSSSRAIENFVGDFSTWYIRRSRDRIGFQADKNDSNTALSVMYGVLVTVSKLLAPFMPFVSETIFNNLVGDGSIHLQDYPTGDKSLLDKKLIEDMKKVRQIVEMGHAKRKEENIKLRQPLASLTYFGSEQLDQALEELLAEEVNVKTVQFTDSKGKQLSVELDTKLTPELAKEGEARDLIRQIQQLRKDASLTLEDKTEIVAPSWPKEFEEQIIKGTASVSIKVGSELKVTKVQ
ncbi:MAG: isoleucine--tRNA ligase [Candidatus Daviesbacteria bacterium]|nr:isoleucine--tRNA ligase [Candidatus Daviesbacteria bacterium]